MFNTCALAHGQRVQLQHGDSPCPVDHDMKPERIRTGLTPSLTGGSRTRTRVPAEEGGTLSCAPSAVADAGNGGPLNWPPSAHAVARKGRPVERAPFADAVAGKRRRACVALRR